MVENVWVVVGEVVVMFGLVIAILVRLAATINK